MISSAKSTKIRVTILAAFHLVVGKSLLTWQYLWSPELLIINEKLDQSWLLQNS